MALSGPGKRHIAVAIPRAFFSEFFPQSCKTDHNKTSGNCLFTAALCYLLQSFFDTRPGFNKTYQEETTRSCLITPFKKAVIRQ